MEEDHYLAPAAKKKPKIEQAAWPNEVTVTDAHDVATNGSPIKPLPKRSRWDEVTIDGTGVVGASVADEPQRWTSDSWEFRNWSDVGAGAKHRHQEPFKAPDVAGDPPKEVPQTASEAGQPRRTLRLTVPPPFYQQIALHQRPVLPAPDITWLEVEDGAPFLNVGSFPPVGPALYHDDKIHRLSSSAHSLLQELLGDVASEVSFQHDPGWKDIPEVAGALRQAGGAETALCVARCASRNLWAVGLAGKWRARENVAKLALCVALAWNHDNFSAVASRWAEFANLCRASGYHCYEGIAAKLANKPRGAKEGDSWNREVTWKRGDKRERGDSRELGGEKRERREDKHERQKWDTTTQAVTIPSVQADGVHLTWIQLSRGQSSPEILETLSVRKTLALGFTKDSSLVTLPGSTQPLLRDLVGELSEVEIHHDPGWDTFPAVGAALKAAGGPEECLCIAVCKKFNVWAVGLGSKWKQRESVAKLALCVAITLKTSEFEDVIQTWTDFLSFRERVRKASVPASSFYPTDDHPDRRQAAAKEPPREAQPDASFPRDVPLWTRVPSSKQMPLEVRTCRREVLVFSTEMKGNLGLIKSADEALDRLAVNVATDVEYFDDPDWTVFPTVADIVRSLGQREECLCVAVCQSRGAWGIGISNKKRNRTVAAKVALVGTLVMESQEDGYNDDSEYPVPVISFVQEARAARAAATERWAQKAAN